MSPGWQRPQTAPIKITTQLVSGPRIGIAYDFRRASQHHGSRGLRHLLRPRRRGHCRSAFFSGPLFAYRFWRWPGRMPRDIFLFDALARLPDSQPQCVARGRNLGSQFVPCLGAFRVSPAETPPAHPNYACSGTGPGVIPSQFLFGLVVPRKFVAPNTQQWNLTVQRSLGRDWVFEIGYVGTHAVHLRETRTFGAQLATAANPSPLRPDGTPYNITESTVANGPARSVIRGINYYNGMQIFADDAYSHYHSLQTRSRGAGARDISRLPTLSQNRLTLPPLVTPL